MVGRRSIAVLGAAAVLCARAVAADNPSGAAILQELRQFSQTGSVLMIAAHPDDENTQLLTYLARGRHYRTAYLSLTRGDGGQNVLGPEFGEELGLIRTEELLAARRLDLAQQFFTRAMDFGFSKRADETLKTWDQQAITADIVRVIRTFQPDVIVTRFNPDIPGGVGTHGHHTASAILARDAFLLLQKDPNAFPDQLKQGLQPWVPKRLLMNMGGGDDASAVRIDISGTDPVLNVPFATIAGQSRAQHKSQGFGQGGGGGGRGGAGVPRTESFTLLAGASAHDDIMDGIDTTWNRLDAASDVGPRVGHEIDTLITGVIHDFSPQNPAASVPALLQMKALLDAHSNQFDPVLLVRRSELDHLIADCMGLTVRSTNPATAIPGDTLHITCTATLTADVPVRWIDVRTPSVDDHPSIAPTDLHAPQAATQIMNVTLPADTPVSQPYWLREDALPGLFRVADPTLIGRPENPPVLPLQYVFEVSGQKIVISDEPVQLSKGTAEAHDVSVLPRRLEVLAPVSLAFSSDVSLFAPGQSKPLAVRVTPNISSTTGTVRIDAPAGWKVDPPTLPLTLHDASSALPLTFTVTAPAQPGSTPAIFTAVATINGHDYSTGCKTIDYPHIPHLTLQPPAHVRAVVLDLHCTAKNIAYLPGAGDSVAQCIEQMGCTVTTLSAADLTVEKLKPFDAVVLGVRALNVRSDIPSLQPLFDYASAGGTVIVQYNRPEGLKFPEPAPFHVRLSASRVTDETGPVTFLAPNHPALNIPNKIVPADFDNWIQERSIYHPVAWDPPFTPLLSAGDPGEKPLTGALLIADKGKGHFVYTSLVFFRELPAGVPGAYRLFANLLSLGK